MTAPDPLPQLVRDFIQEPRGPEAAQLAQQVHRHVDRVTRSYPDAYFALGQRSDESVHDLADRVFTSCARVPKGRFPFSGREPFRAFVQEQFDGRAIRYHSFYAKLSITREILRDDYAHNLCRDPVLRWRADLYRDLGRVLDDLAEPLSQGRGLPPRFRLKGQGPVVAHSLDQVRAQLRDPRPADLAALVRRALFLAGPLTRSRLTELAEAVLDRPAPIQHEAPITPAGDPALALVVRRAVLAAWQDLDDDDRSLLAALARGASYDELIAAHPRFKHRVAVSRAVGRVGRLFVTRVAADVSGEEARGDTRPKELLEYVLDVLVEVLPQLLPPAPQEAP